jgi:hypothetical protein
MIVTTPKALNAQCGQNKQLLKAGLNNAMAYIIIAFIDHRLYRIIVG